MNYTRFLYDRDPIFMSFMKYAFMLISVVLNGVIVSFCVIDLPYYME